MRKLFVAVATLGAVLVANGAGAQAQTSSTFQAAYAAAAYGDVIELPGGTYPAQVMSYVSGKDSEADEPDVVFRPKPGEAVIVQGGLTGYGLRHVTFENIDFQGGVVFECEDSGVPTEAKGQHPLDLTVTRSRMSFQRSENAFGLLVAGNEIGPSSTVIKVGGSGDIGGVNCTDEPPENITFEGNDIHNFRESAAASHMECIFVEGGHGITIRRNTIRGCSVFGIFFKAQLAAGAFGMRDILVENNFLGHPVASAFRTAGSRAISFSSGSYVNLTVRSNSINARLELRDDLATFTNTLVEGNLSNDRGGGCATPGITWRGNAWLAAGQSCPDDLASGIASGWLVVETPAEINSSSSDAVIDYHLTLGAWAIDKAPFGPALDLDGQLRPIGAAFDVGADEAGTTAPLDTVPPVLTLPADISVEAPDLLGAIVAYSVSATDDKDPTPSVICAPASGSLFPLGINQVLCEARDVAGNASQGTFLVTVLAPVDDPPSDPGDLNVAAYTQRTVTISWPGATDDVGIAGYRLYRDGTYLTTAGPLARMAKFSVSWGEHTIVVEAVDTAGQRTPDAIQVKGLWQEVS